MEINGVSILDYIGATAHENAVGKGFYEDYARVIENLTDDRDIAFVKKIWLSHRLMLIVTELAEGAEAIRKANYSCSPGTNGLCEELADTQIRLADLYTHMESEYPVRDSLTEAVMNKMDFNAQRPYKHNKVL